MRFLTYVWIPWWLLLGLFEWSRTPHHTAQERGAMAFLVLAYGGVAFLVTFIYGCTRVFSRASRDAQPRR